MFSTFLLFAYINLTLVKEEEEEDKKEGRTRRKKQIRYSSGISAIRASPHGRRSRDVKRSREKKNRALARGWPCFSLGPARRARSRKAPVARVAIMQPNLRNCEKQGKLQQRRLQIELMLHAQVYIYIYISGVR